VINRVGRLLVAAHGDQANEPTRSPAASVPWPAPPHPNALPRSRRSPSDTTDAEWALIELLLPPPACTQPTGGRPETHPGRQIVDAIRYLVHNGWVWRALPTDFSPWPTV
jgi:Putative transposase of IS4/5 family (DUF4096)